MIDTDKLKVGQICRVKDIAKFSKELTEKGIRHSVGTDFKGHFVRIEPEDYDVTTAKKDEIEVYVFPVRAGFFMHSKLIRDLKEIENLLGVTPSAQNVVLSFMEQNDAKRARNLLKQTYTVGNVVKAFIPKEVVQNADESTGD